MNTLEKKGCRSILKKLDPGDLLSLKDTITRKQISAISGHEAIKIILCYSQSSAELLKRKKIRRDVLFQYLSESGVVVPINAEKHQLITRCLQFWGSDFNQNSFDSELDDEDPTTPHQPAAGTTNQWIGLANSHHGVEVSHQTQIEVSHQTRIEVSHQTQIAVSHHMLTDQSQQSSAVTSTTTNNEQQILGETFASWFYKMLNSHNPAMGQTPEDFGPHHFWSDIKLQLLTVTPQPTSDCYNGSVLVAQRFLALIKEELLLFNPNISSDGVNVMSDRHGLTCVLVCGTIHRHNDCLGVFQQIFGLVRDPRFENNWKIKTTKLRIQIDQVTTVPRLQDVDNTELLALDLCS